MTKARKANNIAASKSKNEIVGKRIKELRDCKKVTLDELADVLGFTSRNMVHIESGDRGLTIENAEIIANYFGRTLDYIYLGKEDVKLGLNPVCQLVSDAMASINDEARKDLYMRTIIDISQLFMNLEEK